MSTIESTRAVDEDVDLEELLEPITVEQYHAMIEAGILPEGVPVELLDGLLFRKDRRDAEGDILTVGTNHATVLDLLAEALRSICLNRKAYVRVQRPVTILSDGEPEPDISIVHGQIGDYGDHHPQDGQIELVVEVAHRSRSNDRTRKLRIYAAAGIPQYWIVNLRDNIVEVYTRPQPESRAYADRTDYPPAGVIPLHILGNEVPVPVSEFLQ